MSKLNWKYELAENGNRVALPRMRIVQTIGSTRMDNGGPSRSVPALCDALVELGLDTHLITGLPANSCISSRGTKCVERMHGVREAPLFRQLRLARGFQEAVAGVFAEFDGPKLLHDHGLWLPTNHAIASYGRKYGIPRVVSPRGMLSHWSMSRRKLLKRLMWQLYQQRDLKTAIAFHATSEEEATDIRNLGFSQPVVVVPNGVNLPEELPSRITSESKQVLCLSRIHPVKGLINLVKSWARVRPSAQWKLLIVGPDECGHRFQVERCIAEEGVSANVEIRGPVDDVMKWPLLVNSTLFVLPSFTENFGIAVAEAMAAGLPVITTQGTPWQVLREKHLGWWVDATVDGLSQALSEAIHTDLAQLKVMGLAAREYVKLLCSWGSVATQFAHFYSSLSAA